MRTSAKVTGSTIGSRPRRVLVGVVVLDDDRVDVGVQLQRADRFLARLGDARRMRVQAQPRRRLGDHRHPAIAGDLAHELAQQIEQPIERAAQAEVAHLGRDHRLEERVVEVGRDAIADVGVGVAELGEEVVARRASSSTARDSVRTRSPMWPLTT